MVVGTKQIEVAILSSSLRIKVEMVPKYLFLSILLHVVFPFLKRFYFKFHTSLSMDTLPGCAVAVN
ncbi:hypothetical protein SLEP1_g22073 [Rubroshorea leprosula]|uniref:Uncharacterized protein n=1 Tax=Rubroshorea leprosula TaxID=152421 RepID=A0AAV5JE19_9ROSI|nr:hypothetical protein SLEP1_g22073 [Rubroshorea leprosula]